MPATVISIHNGISGNPEYRLASPVNLDILDGEQIAIVGDNGAGKSLLIEAITGAHPFRGDAISFDFSPSKKKLICENVKYITFRDSYGDWDGNYYLQQRWNQIDIDEQTPRVGGILTELLAREKTDPELWKKLASIFHLDDLMDKYTISLSSGELRKFQLAKTLIPQPRVLIMDNPFIGLDSQTRDEISDLFSELTTNIHLLIILVLSKRDEIPSFITHIVNVEGLGVKEKITAGSFKKENFSSQTGLSSECLSLLEQLPVKDISKEPFYPKGECPEIVRCESVTIRYGEHTILRDLNLTINEGERWAIKGRNGSGKSTLLSLICADNPQSYACDISLFGHKRGSGESIWDIKKHIGYVSPEMHRAYQKNISALEIVASGLHDTVGLFVRPTAEELTISRKWMKIFGIDQLCDRSYLKLSSGEQRLCLLARAFVKDPELLILDEPFHGLDIKRRQMASEIIEVFLRRPHKTFIMVSHYDSEFPERMDHLLELVRTR